jgi:hypothetical protein
MSVAIQSAVTSPELYRLPIVWPSQLKLYRECPERYYHKYVARRRAVEPFSRDLARGIALHAVLADCFSEFQKSGGYPINVQDRVEVQLRQSGYPTDLTDARIADEETVSTNVKWVLSEFDCTAEVLGIEQTLSYYHRGTDACPASLLRAKVDLVLAHTDGTLEHVDFKGGKVRSDPIQEVISRIVVAAEYGERCPTIRTTTLFASEQKRVSAVLDRAACRETWASIRQAVAEIQSGANWTPSPSPFCGTCPYFGNGCSITFGGAGPDAVFDWLNGSAD